MPKVLTGRDTEPSPEVQTRAQPPSSRSVWAWTGLAFLIVGGVDLVLTWFPMQFGNREWEFGSVTAALNGLPVPLLGLAALIWASAEGRRKWMATLSAVVGAILFVGVLVGLILWATGIPLALQAVPANLSAGLKKALLKTSIQGVVYPLLLAFLTVSAWRTARRRA